MYTSACRARISCAGFVILLQIVMTAPAGAQPGDVDFSYNAPGKLAPGAGQGRQDRKIYLPGIVFPVELVAEPGAFPNSQVHGIGGQFGPPGSLCADKNYLMPWTDTYCEKRDWDMPLCPTGKGHQGNDIRGPRAPRPPGQADKNCIDDHWNVVAVEDGVITRVSSYPIVYMKGDSGTLYRYMHVNPNSIQVQANQRVTAGTPLAKISNFMEGQANQTSFHVHFDARQNVPVQGTVQSVYVPPYTSLIAAYRKGKGLPPMDSGGSLQVDPQREK
jgi:murein DD-endopeptidase MepM/ murein hydrolase activator NlpD